MSTATATTTTAAAAVADGTGWRSLIYVPAKVSDTDGITITEPATLQVLDQLLLPHTISYITIDTIQKGWDVIHHMNIRGAPLIAIVAILTLGIIDLQCHRTTQDELRQIEAMNTTGSVGATAASAEEDTFDAIQTYIHGKIDFLATSRPTAVNLFNALRDVKDLIQSLRNPSSNSSLTTTTSTSKNQDKQRIIAAIVQYAEQMLRNDEADCRAIGDYGAQEIVTQLAAAHPNRMNGTKTSSSPSKITVMTICNTGSLATANYGTALGVIRSIHYKYEQLQQVVVLETRPYNQGSRLTAFECIQDALPNPILICDNMVTAFINNYHQAGSDTTTPKKNMVIVVGADRVVANGDTANKIGTYQLAVLAFTHQIPFYVAAPTTTLDLQTKQGSEIHIEIRPSIELIQSSHAPNDIPVWNPAFDVTPAKYITGIITEKGVIHPTDDGTFDIAAFLLDRSTTAPNDESSKPTAAAVPVDDVTEYTEQSVSSLPVYIATNVPEAMKILNVTTADEMEAVEMGDGNLNLVFIVSNKSTGSNEKQAKIIVKQALPYVRCVGESWPLTLDRAFYEYTALQAQKKACSEHVPNLYYFSKKDALIVMEYLAPPIQILRKGLIAGIRYNTMSYDMGIFCAKTLFRTSGFALSTTELRKRVEFWSTNSMMCALTEQVVFTEPYIVASNNHWTTPYLDDDKKAIETDTELNLAASKWKMKFVTHTEALIHADLHTGSVMCANDADHQTYVIDPEFAFYGPAAFDTGAFIANLLLSYVSQKAHRIGETSNSDYDEWILQQIVVFWNTFMEQFIKYWNDPNEYTGFMYDCMKDTLQEDVTVMKQCQEEYMQQFLCDTIGFAGMKMLRRIVGIAHVEDLQSITDMELRSVCERRGLTIAQYFIIRGCHSSSFKSIEDVIEFVRNTK